MVQDQADKGLEGLPSQDIFSMIDKDEAPLDTKISRKLRKDGIISEEEFTLFFDEIALLIEESRQKFRLTTEAWEKFVAVKIKGGGEALPLWQGWRGPVIGSL